MRRPLEGASPGPLEFLYGSPLKENPASKFFFRHYGDPQSDSEDSLWVTPSLPTRIPDQLAASLTGYCIHRISAPTESPMRSSRRECAITTTKTMRKPFLTCLAPRPTIQITKLSNEGLPQGGTRQPQRGIHPLGLEGQLPQCLAKGPSEGGAPTDPQSPLGWYPSQASSRMVDSLSSQSLPSDSLPPCLLAIVPMLFSDSCRITVNSNTSVTLKMTITTWAEAGPL